VKCSSLKTFNALEKDFCKAQVSDNVIEYIRFQVSFMIMSYHSFLLRFFVVVLAFGACIQANQSVAQTLDVQKIRAGAHPDKVRLVIETNQAPKFRSFTLSDPYRLVIDLPEFQWKADTQPDLGAFGVNHVRYGTLKDGVSRLVLEMKEPTVLHGAFVLPQTPDKPYRLVVDYKTVSTSDYVHHKGKILGDLDVDDAAGLAKLEAQKTEVISKAKPTPPKPKVRSIVRKSLIVLDPGHGGNDPGAVGAGKAYEKVVVLALAKELKKQLEASGRYQVKMTREDDTYIRLRDRVKFARMHDADLFVSIHADSINKSHVSGVSVYTLSENASDKQSAKLAARENRSDIIAGVDLSVEDEDVFNILMDLAMRDTMNQSKFFANKMVSGLKGSGIRMLENPHRYAGFAVLKSPDVPSILIEAGFMSNRNEAAKLMRSDYRRKIAKAVKGGIDSYFEYVDKNAQN
jgi:N-acetylmuramoyl-L-alanine amidase